MPYTDEILTMEPGLSQAIIARAACSVARITSPRPRAVVSSSSRVCSSRRPPAPEYALLTHPSTDPAHRRDRFERCGDVSGDRDITDEGHDASGADLAHRCGLVERLSMASHDEHRCPASDRSVAIPRPRCPPPR
jgi:hypothetical protein